MQKMAQVLVPPHGLLTMALRCVRAAAFPSLGTVLLKERHKSIESDTTVATVGV